MECRWSGNVEQRELASSLEMWEPPVPGATGVHRFWTGQLKGEWGQNLTNKWIFTETSLRSVLGLPKMSWGRTEGNGESTVSSYLRAFPEKPGMRAMPRVPEAGSSVSHSAQLMCWTLHNTEACLPSPVSFQKCFSIFKKHGQWPGTQNTYGELMALDIKHLWGELTGRGLDR